jgi:hypothetical protein
MTAKLSGSPPGLASLRGGLEFVLSKDLNLDLSKAQPSPAVAAVLAPHDPGPAVWTIPGGPGPVRAAMAVLATGDVAAARKMRADIAPGGAIDATDLGVLDAMIAVASAQSAEPTLDLLVDRGGNADPKARPRPQMASLLLAALGTPMSGADRGAFAGFSAGETRSAAARLLALDLAAEAKRPGEAALQALRISADAGLGGPAAGDRAQIIRALMAVGLEADARAFAIEGLLALR